MQRTGGPPAREKRPAPQANANLGPALLIFAVALLLRVGYAWVAAGPSATPSSDALSYDTIAWNLANGSGFSLEGAGGRYPAAFAPVLPWMTSFVYRAAGHRFFFALLLVCVTGALIPLLLQSLGSSTYGGGVGRVAAWLAVFHPLLVFFSGYLLTETPFTAAMLLALVASVNWLRTPRPARALGTGMLWGIAALTRATGLVLPGLVAIWAWGPLGLTLAPRDRIRQVAMLGLGVALVVGPWTLRNAVTLHAFIPVTTGAGRAFLDGNNPVVWSDPATRGGANSTWDLEPWATEFRGHDAVEVDAIAKKDAIAFLRAHVAEWPAMAAAKLSRTWRLTTEGGGTGTWQRSGSPLTAFLRRIDPLLVWSALTFPFAIFGLVRTLTGARRWFLALPFLLILFSTALSVVYWGALRMRVPIEPLVLLYAAAGFEEVRRRWLTRRRGLRVIAGHLSK